MICPSCGSNVPEKRKTCERCGSNIELYKKIWKASNAYYNDGLSRAKVRDLSGAVQSLKTSLELNKSNTNARNLLGLIYFEMGETVAALSEWVISKHFQAEENDADDYINAVQSNPTKLEGLNQAIKRYNNALISAKQGSDDLAILQLKKVIQLNSHFIRAFHLLALLYLKNEENEKAKKILRKVGKIDVSNTTTLRYLLELEPLAPMVANEGKDRKDKERNYNGGSIVPVSSYREDKPNIMAFVNLVIGVVIGISVTAFLIIPTVKKNLQTEENLKYVDYSAGLAQLEEKDETINALKEEKTQLEATITGLQEQLGEIEISEEDHTEVYNSLYAAVEMYLNEVTKDEEDRDFSQVADTLASLPSEELQGEWALKVYNRMKAEILPAVAEHYYEIGHDLYGDYKYEDALTELEKVVFYDPTHVDALYFMARSYHRLGDEENAILYYTIVITDFSDSNRANQAEEFLDQLTD